MSNRPPISTPSWRVAPWLASAAAEAEPAESDGSMIWLVKSSTNAVASNEKNGAGVMRVPIS